MNWKVAWGVFCAIALCWIAAMLHRGLELGWDEIEFFRASRWIAEGKLPYRDFWEHHTPLQWFLFAPVAAFVRGAGAASIVAMRWVQVALWLGTFLLIDAILVRLRVRSAARAAALALLLASPSFFRSAIEFRVDVPGNLAWFAGIVLVVGVPATRRRWIGFGMFMSLAVLANMRLAPFVILTALLLFFRTEERWAPNPRALWMAVGVLPTALLFVSYLVVTRSFEPFIEQVVRTNLAESVRYGTFWVTLLNPLATGDVAAIVVWVLGAIAVIRSLRKPGVRQLVSILFVASIATVAAMSVHYPYHLQQSYLLLLPLAALTLDEIAGSARWQVPAAVIVLFALVTTLALQVARVGGGHFGKALAFQDRVMIEVDRRTRPGDRVFDGSGYALRRVPAYRYWFLTNPVRVAAARKRIEPYDLPQMASDPPSAVIYNIRMQRWFEIYPRLAAYAVSHYVPLYRNLWVPGLTGRVEGRGRIVWSVPADGRYEIFASTSLARHPWFSRPLEYAAIEGPAAARLMIAVRRLPPVVEGLAWKVDGVAIDPTRVLQLRRGARVELISTLDHDAGVVVVPEGTDLICMAPEEVFVF